MRGEKIGAKVPLKMQVFSAFLNRAWKNVGLQARLLSEKMKVIVIIYQIYLKNVESIYFQL
jgi:hypothetical protein